MISKRSCKRLITNGLCSCFIKEELYRLQPSEEQLQHFQWLNASILPLVLLPPVETCVRSTTRACSTPKRTHAPTMLRYLCLIQTLKTSGSSIFQIVH